MYCAGAQNSKSCGASLNAENDAHAACVAPTTLEAASKGKRFVCNRKSLLRRNKRAEPVKSAHQRLAECSTAFRSSPSCAKLRSCFSEPSLQSASSRLRGSCGDGIVMTAATDRGAGGATRSIRGLCDWLGRRNARALFSEPVPTRQDFRSGRLRPLPLRGERHCTRARNASWQI